MRVAGVKKLKSKNFKHVKNNFAFFLILWFLVGCSPGRDKNTDGFKLDYFKLRKEEVVESLVPVRHGNPGEIPFWNVASKRFLNVPSFNFRIVEGAGKYEFTALAS